jgi:hypothetical protein
MSAAIREQFTPGSWEYHRPTLARPSAWIYGQDERPVCELNDNRNEYEANARLIAAAPDMYGALQVLREYFEETIAEHPPEAFRPVTLLRRALAKAEGRES